MVLQQANADAQSIHEHRHVSIEPMSALRPLEQRAAEASAADAQCAAAQPNATASLPVMRHDQQSSQPLTRDRNLSAMLLTNKQK
jgi:hypothetical protein